MPCYIEHTKDGDTMFLCGDLGPHCAADKCAAVSGWLAGATAHAGASATRTPAAASKARSLSTSGLPVVSRVSP